MKTRCVGRACIIARSNYVLQWSWTEIDDAPNIRSLAFLSFSASILLEKLVSLRSEREAQLLTVKIPDTPISEWCEWSF